MRLSYYTKIFYVDNVPWTRILYSTKTSAIALVPKEVLESIEKGQLDPEDEKTLWELGLLVEDPEKEREEIIDLYENAHVPNLQILLCMNLTCNFACKYCFEEDVKTGLFMGRDVLNAAISFMQKELKKGGGELLLTIYGGEPLLSLDMIKEALIKANDMCGSMGMKMRAAIITNGSLLTGKVVEELKALGLEKARVTLDGPPEIHNHFRPFKGGGPSFDVIMRNIEEFIDIIDRFEIAGNYSQENYKEFPRLLDILFDKGLGPDKVEYLRFEPIIRQTKGASIYKGGCSSINEAWVAEASLFLREEILKRGYKTRRIEPIFCLVNNKRAFVINIDGGLYKCPGMLGRKEFQVGDVFHGLKSLEPYRPGRWKNERCASCVYLPLCFGGCRFMSYLRHGDMDHLDCQRPFLEKNLEAFVKQDIRFKKIG